MICPNCNGENFHRIAKQRRYRKFVCDDCGYTDVFLPYGNREDLN